MFALLNDALICSAHVLHHNIMWVDERGWMWVVYTDKRAGLPMVYLDLARF